MSNIPTDPAMYQRILKKYQKKMPKSSAYRSGLIVKDYKEQFKKKYGNKSPYNGKKTSKGLVRWFAEDWRNVRTGKIGYQRKGDLYRPTRRITSKTPVTKGELTKAEIKKATKEKKATGRVKRFRTELTKKQKEMLKKHSVHHTKKHMDEMKKLMLSGKTFKQAHDITMKKIGK